ncbi:MAG: hypothetical protein M3R24_37700 [Chloroflexota bacterium]|nr:hypothetical protein [Chloroflexota bacterium]
MRAIETVYNGYRFRSRVEARWAVFFDGLALPYNYEPEGFDLGGIWYLPDFWLPQQYTWIEIKGQQPTEDEKRKAFLLMKATNASVFILPDEPWHTTGGYAWIPDSPNDDYLHYPCYWSECLRCAFITICHENKSFCDLCYFRRKEFTPENKISPRLVAAYNAARQARFEHL